MKRSRLILLFVLAIWGAQSVWAQGWQSGRQGGGWNKLEMCHGCHDMGMRGGMGMGRHLSRQSSGDGRRRARHAAS
jgi:hypothetical protein